MLGNIVAVTSIIAVVSLIQGMNAYVTDAIVSDVGADNFTIQRMPIVRTEADEERVRNNPRITLDEATPSALQRQRRRRGGAGAVERAASAYGNESLDGVQVHGVTRDYIYFSTFDAERGRLISPAEVDREPAGDVIGCRRRRQAVRPIDPLDKIIKIGRLHFRVVGVSKKKGSVFGKSQDDFAVIPLGSFQQDVRVAPVGLQLLVKPKSPELVQAAMDDATVALRIERRLRPTRAGQLRHVHVRHAARHLPAATNGIFAVLVGVVALSLVVGGIVIMNIMLMVVSERTREIGLRKALGARRRDIMWQILTESVTLSTFGGVVGTLLGFVAGAHHQQADAAAGGRRGLVGRARHRHHRGRRPVLRPVSGDARGRGSIRSKRLRRE